MNSIKAYPYPLPNNISETVQYALQEDIATGDITASLIPETQQASATILCRVNATIAGSAWVNETFQQLDDTITIQWHVNDGDTIDANTMLCTLHGNARTLLSGERVALNFLQTLSATATRTAQYVAIVHGTRASILDTRKTLPGLRLAQKYAVLCGGGDNHRIGLYDMVLIKENHIMAAGSIQAAIQQARQLHPRMKVEVETENMDEFQQASNAKADIIMLDEFSLDDMRKAVQNNPHNIPLEASGGVNLSSIRAIAETGIDRISIGEITKDINAIDLSMRFRPIL